MTQTTAEGTAVGSLTPQWEARSHAPDGYDDGLAIEVTAGVLHWRAPDGARAIRVADDISSSHAALAPRLAIAAVQHREWLSQSPRDLVLDRYDTVHFLRHQLALMDDPSVRVVAGAVGPIQQGIATAFGADLGAPLGTRGEWAPPAELDVQAALTVLAAAPWRFAPAITLAVSAAEWTRGMRDGSIGIGLEALVHA